jgi:hypothetical protein
MIVLILILVVLIAIVLMMKKDEGTREEEARAEVEMLRRLGTRGYPYPRRNFFQTYYNRRYY